MPTGTVQALYGRASSLDELVVADLPASGFYSWWQVDQALPGVLFFGTEHPSQEGLRLIYVGIGPGSATSSATFRGRLVGNHVEGNIGSSTLRLTLASHLIGQLELRPIRAAKKVVLRQEDNLRLTRWMREHLRVAWVGHPSPWAIEATVIHEMLPPLNIDHNRDHPYCRQNQALRRAFKQAVV